MNPSSLPFPINHHKDLQWCLVQALGCGQGAMHGCVAPRADEATRVR
jgi:hypothetical protein